MGRRDKSYTEESPFLHQTIGEYLQEIAERFPDRPAVVVRHQQIRWNYREYLIQIDRLCLLYTSDA
ncbi:hypothetical protein, partial [Aeromonas salmonicida]|uniref:hypothetical protein n=1 Tax=Aeromonas salmonicida TaxID=645 RepID=UPI003D31E782